MFQSNNPTEETPTTKELWEGDIDSIPYEPTSKESAIEQVDEHIGQQIQLNKNDYPVLVKIVSRQQDAAGSLIGRKNPDPKLDSRIYNVQYPDGHFERYSTNVLSEALNETMDHDGYDKSYISEICGYRKNMKHAITKEIGFVKSHNGRNVPVITTKGWKVNVRWLDGSTNWIPLNVFKNSQPLILANYAKTMKIHDEPAFLWWVPHVLRKASRLLSKVKTLYHKKNLKFGIEVPKSIRDAILLDKENGNTF